MNQNPIVPVNIDKPDLGKHVESRVMNTNNNNPNSQINFTPLIDNFNEVSTLNSKKKVVSKFVEVTVKTILTFEDGSKKESIETENHTYK